jgi:hypothetical protein
MGYYGIAIITVYYEEMSERDYVIAYQTDKRLIISSAAAPKVWCTEPQEIRHQFPADPCM